MWFFGTPSAQTPTSKIEYTRRTNSRSRSIQIKIERGGKVIVSAPSFIPQFVIDQFVQKQAAWIEQKLQLINNEKKGPTTVSIFGKEYTKIVDYIPDKPLGISVAKNRLLANTPEAARIAMAWGAAQEKQLVRFLKATASTYIITRTQQLAETMHVTYGNLTLREQSSRWGSCSSRGNLNFNWRLVHAPPEVIDYVIVHELAHRVHMDHSSRFWALVAKYDSAYDRHRNWLKRHGHGLS
ncbi:M48 family metallopeptidase [Candidatus Woesebacteria bacterium]|nr:M48 family metallopeptidase [Candidatus Woesebacteria bacterium]